MAACEIAHLYVEVARLLLEAGADPTLAAEDGEIVLHVVARRGHTDLVDMLLPANPPR